MPKIRQLKVEKVYLPSYEDLPKKEQGFVMLETPLRMNSFGNIPQSESQLDQQAYIMSQKIKDWNLCGEDDKKLEINAKNLLLLDPSDFAIIAQKLELLELMKRLSKSKKKS